MNRMRNSTFDDNKLLRHYEYAFEKLKNVISNIVKTENIRF